MRVKLVLERLQFARRERLLQFRTLRVFAPHFHEVRIGVRGSQQRDVHRHLIAQRSKEDARHVVKRKRVAHELAYALIPHRRQSDTNGRKRKKERKRTQDVTHNSRKRTLALDRVVAHQKEKRGRKQQKEKKENKKTREPHEPIFARVNIIFE